jgi:hypothetical protein
MINKRNKEIKYLLRKVDEIYYGESRFRVMIEKEKYIFGVVSAENEPSSISKIIQYNVIYETIYDLDFKIKLSFKKAIEYAYSTKVQEQFSLLKNSSVEEIYSYYYIENALFRVSSLWDMLAQLYRLYYQIDVEPYDVKYKQIFNPNSRYSKKFKNKATLISNYINQEDDTAVDGEWKGNHKFVNNCRNKMTHRNSPNITELSDFDVNFKHNPTYLLKRIIEDYNVVSKFISDILDDIEEDIKNNM